VPAGLRVAAVSSKNLKGDIEANVKRHTMWVERAAEALARFIGFPECSLTGYQLSGYIAIPLRCAATAAIEQLARNHGVFISAGLVEKRGKRYYNSQFLVGPNGWMGVTRKINLAGKEPRFFARGSGLPVFDVGVCKAGIAICADATYYEPPRVLAFRGAEMIFAPHAGYLGHTPKSWIDWRRARWPIFARDSAVIIVGCNNAGLFERPHPGEHDYRFASGALIVDEAGRVLAQSRIRKNRETMLLADLSFANLRKIRKTHGHWQEFQRERFYAGILASRRS